MSDETNEVLNCVSASEFHSQFSAGCRQSGKNQETVCGQDTEWWSGPACSVGTLLPDWPAWLLVCDWCFSFLLFQLVWGNIKSCVYFVIGWTSCRSVQLSPVIGQRVKQITDTEITFFSFSFITSTCTWSEVKLNSQSASNMSLIFLLLCSKVKLF